MSQQVLSASKTCQEAEITAALLQNLLGTWEHMPKPSRCVCKIYLLASEGWMCLEGVEGSDVTTEQKPEQKGEEATTVEAKIFQGWKHAKDNSLQETFLFRQGVGRFLFSPAASDLALVRGGAGVPPSDVSVASRLVVGCTKATAASGGARGWSGRAGPAARCQPGPVPVLTSRGRVP